MLCQPAARAASSAARASGSLGDAPGIGADEIVGHHFHAGAGGGGEPGHGDRVVFAEGILYRHDRVAVQPAKQQFAQPVGIDFAMVPGQPVASAATEIGGCNVQRDGHILAGR